MDIHESVDRILASDVTLGDAFYDTFLNRYPQVQKFFEGVNMQRQAVSLTMALLIVEQYQDSSFQATARYLQELGAKHREWGIPINLYPYFRDALLGTLQQFHGDDWDDELAGQWSAAIDGATEEMLKGYEDESTE